MKRDKPMELILKSRTCNDEHGMMGQWADVWLIARDGITQMGLMHGVVLAETVAKLAEALHLPLEAEHSTDPLTVADDKTEEQSLFDNLLPEDGDGSGHAEADQRPSRPVQAPAATKSPKSHKPNAASQAGNNSLFRPRKAKG